MLRGDPQGCVFQNHRQAGATHYAVKILDTESEEADICNKLLKLSSASPNHTLPCDIILSQPNPPIIIMPLMVDLLSCDFDLWDDSTLLRYFHQILEVSSELYSYTMYQRSHIALGRASTSFMTCTSLIG